MDLPIFSPSVIISQLKNGEIQPSFSYTHIVLRYFSPNQPNLNWSSLLPREFEMEIYDTNGKEVMHYYRPYTCNCCNYCCLSAMTIECPPKNIIGRIKQRPGNCRKMLHVECPVGTHIATINCPHFCKSRCCGDIPYVVVDLQGK